MSAVITVSKPAQMNIAALKSMESKIDQLPLLPQVLVRILQISTTQDDYFEEIDKLAREDPPFAVRVLAMANSAGSAPTAPIKSIKAALTRIGASTITSLVASLAVQRVFVPSSPSQVALWQHSVRVAVAAEIVAQLLPSMKVDKGQAYLTGLLHDIGRFVMFDHAPENLLKVDESHWHSPEELIEADVEIFKFTHSELGYIACTHWGLPDDIAQTVRRHHDQLEGVVQPGSIEANLLCIMIADRLAVMILDNQEFEDISPDELTELIEQKCLWSPEVRKLLKANVLAMKVPQIKTRCHQLLGGLGMA